MVCVCVRGYLKIKLFDARGAEKGVGVGGGGKVGSRMGPLGFSILNILIFYRFKKTGNKINIILIFWVAKISIKAYKK